MKLVPQRFLYDKRFQAYSLPGKLPRNVPPRYITPGNVPYPTLFRFVARFARVSIEDSCRNRFTSTVYFAQSQTTLFLFILFIEGMFRGGNNQGGIFRGRIFWSPDKKLSLNYYVYISFTSNVLQWLQLQVILSDITTIKVILSDTTIIQVISSDITTIEVIQLSAKQGYYNYTSFRTRIY